MKDQPSRVAVISGAGSGIGRALCIQLAKAGYQVIGTDINLSHAEETAALHQTITAKIHDVTNREQTMALAREIYQEWGRIDVLINNAGVSVTAAAETMALADMEWVMNTNFWGVVHGCQAFLPYLLKAPQANLVNISSLFGLIGFPAQSAYCASKFAVRGYTESLRAELMATNVKTLCVHPGVIKTNIARNTRFRGGIANTENHQQLIEKFDRKANVTAEAAAKAIVRTMVKNKPRLLIGKEARVFDWLQRLRPVGYLSLLNKAIAE